MMIILDQLGGETTARMIDFFHVWFSFESFMSRFGEVPEAAR
jgi:hypothetical protein